MASKLIDTFLVYGRKSGKMGEEEWFVAIFCLVLWLGKKDGLKWGSFKGKRRVNNLAII